MLYFVLSFGHARTDRRNKPLPCGRYSHAMLAKDESHALGQVGREQGVDVVVERGGGLGGQAVLLGVPPLLIRGVGALILSCKNYFKNQTSSRSKFSLYPKLLPI